MRSPGSTGAGEGSHSEEQLRERLIEIRLGLCKDLELIAGVILNTGILREIPPIIQQVSGLKIDELEARETRACQKQPGTPALQDQSTQQLLENMRDIEWLVRMHLVAMDDVATRNPVTRPISAEGSFRSFLEAHDILVLQMRNGVADLHREPGSIERARAVAILFNEVLLPHSRAEEESLFPLARAAGDPAVARSADLVEAEHRVIEEGIAEYHHAIERVEQGQSQASGLDLLARGVRGTAELHFAKEEESVIRPLQQKLTSQQFQPVVEDQSRLIGPRLRQHGWHG